jgi:GPI mannosyltransferase 1 subunit M
VLLPVLTTVSLVVMARDQQRRRPTRAAWIALMAGLCHGIAVHAKIYPIIYSITYLTYLSSSSGKPGSPALNTLYSFVTRYVSNPLIWIFSASSLVTFVVITMSGVYFYGPQALTEGLWYHVGRVDHRHNYSLHYYWIYLHRAVVAAAPSPLDASSDQSSSPWVAGVVLLAPQAVLLLFTSLSYFARRALGLTMFFQTFIFVAYNKVLTAQYFAWYVCLLPLCFDYREKEGFVFLIAGHGNDDRLSEAAGVPAAADEATSNRSFATSKRASCIPWTLLRATVLLIFSIASWLGTAYFLELRGYAVHSQNWIAALIFFLAHTNMLRTIVQLAARQVSCSSPQQAAIG